MSERVGYMVKCNDLQETNKFCLDIYRVDLMINCCLCPACNVAIVFRMGPGLKTKKSLCKH